MKTDINGVSQCQKGTENYEAFYTTIRRKRTKLIQYDYRNEDGELFTCVKPTLTECRKARDEHFKPVVVVYTPEQLFAKRATDLGANIVPRTDLRGKDLQLIIKAGIVCRDVGIGFVEERPATDTDIKTMLVVI